MVFLTLLCRFSAAGTRGHTVIPAAENLHIRVVLT
jgi:hypothetical protein